MNKILSQNEVDALLRGVQSGDVDTEKKREVTPPGVMPYDLTNQERMVRGRMPGLEIANERFAKIFRNSLSTLIMRFVDIHIQSMEIIKFGEFMKTIPFPSSINIFKLEPLKGYALLVIEAPLLFAFVEFFFGGSSVRNVKSEGRSFTPIEQRVNKRIVETALNELSEAWSGIVAISPEHVGSEANPQFVTIVTPSEIVIKIEIHIKVEDFTGKLFICIPYSMIECVKERLYSVVQTDKQDDVDQRWLAGLKEKIRDSYVEIVAELGRAKLTFGDLMNLDIGSVINLGKCISDELIIKVEDIPKFNGVPGYSRGNQAIKITKTL
ncbi:MAG: flagellar motor switch protein FliM [Nitrospirota bacterium]